MTFFLPKKPLNRPLNPLVPEDVPSFSQGLGAAAKEAFKDSSFRTFYTRNSVEMENATEALRRLGPDRARQMVEERNRVAREQNMPSQIRDVSDDPAEIIEAFGPNFANQVLEAAQLDAESNPDAWKDLGITPDAVEKDLNAKLQAEAEDYRKTLDMMPSGRAMAEFLGGLAGTAAGAQNLPFMLMGGGGGSLLRVMGREAAINMAAETAFLPTDFDLAERRDEPAPSIVGRLAEAAVGGAVLGGAVEGLGRAVRYFAGRNRATIPGYSPEVSEMIVNAAESALEQQRNPLEAVQRAMRAAPTEPQVSLEVLDNDTIGSISTDAATFQYKEGGDQDGVTDRLRGVKQWEAERAGVALVYEYADGRRVIVDGHQRLALAKTLAAEGQKIELPVRILRESDGVTVEQARARAAIKNIAEGTGTATDAAKVLRDLGISAADLNLPPSSALVRTGEGLSRLDDEAFGMVINERASEAHGGLVGRIIPDQELHANILALVTKLKPRNAFEAEAIIRQAGAAGSTREVQASLFGDEVVAESLYLERARVLDQAIKQLRQDKATFSVLMDRAERITDAGNRLDPKANAEKIQESGVLMQYVQSQANRKGPISDALNDSARELKRTGKPGSAVTRFVDAVRDGIQRGDLDGDAGRLARGDAQPEPAESPDAGPSLFDGDQSLIPGVAPVSERQRLDARQNAPLTGQNRPADDGLFDVGSRSQMDMFSDPASKEARVVQDSIAEDIRDAVTPKAEGEAPRESDFDMDVELPDGSTRKMKASEVLDWLDEGDKASARMDLCGHMGGGT